MIFRLAVRVAALIFICANVASAATLRVPQNFPTIQAAVDAALPDDTVLVSPGLYVENVTITRSLRLRSTLGAQFTTIDGNDLGSPVGVWGTGTENVTISGFTLTRGAFQLQSPLDYPNTRGAGIFIDGVAHATITNNIITGNRGCHGGGVASYYSSLTIRDNIVRENQPMDWCPANGIALYMVGNDNFLPVATVRGNEVVDNVGLGISLQMFGDVTVHENIVTDNRGPPSESISGGGIYVDRSSGRVTSNLIARNFSYDGAGLHLAFYDTFPQSIVVVGNVLLDNEAVGTSGSAAYLYALASSSITFVGNVVRGNSAGPLVACSGGGAFFVRANLTVNPGGPGTGGECAP